VIGAHFFSPANVMKLLEVVRAAQTSRPTIATHDGAGQTIGKTAVLAATRTASSATASLPCTAASATSSSRKAPRLAGGPRAAGLRLSDGPVPDARHGGLDVGWRIRKYREQFRDKSLRYSPIADRLCELGRFGQKTGAGYYRYEGRDGSPIPRRA
jgi:3-hydroxyacyl-CoA dehydrogenase